MHAATRRAKTPRLKPAANPWQALPRLADLFDPDAPQPFFKGSKVPELEELALTETQLLEQTAALLGVSLAQLVRAGALVYAKREFLGHKKYLSPSPAAAEGDSSQVALLRSGSGVAGVADTRIRSAAAKLPAAKALGRDEASLRICRRRVTRSSIPTASIASKRRRGISPQRAFAR